MAAAIRQLPIHPSLNWPCSRLPTRHCDPLRFRYSFHIHLRRSPKFGMIYSPAKESAYCIERRNSRQSLFSSGWNIRRKGGTKKNSADSETVRLVLCFQLRKSVRHSISKSLTAALTPTGSEEAKRIGIREMHSNGQWSHSLSTRRRRRLFTSAARVVMWASWTTEWSNTWLGISGGGFSLLHSRADHSQ